MHKITGVFPRRSVSDNNSFLKSGFASNAINDDKSLNFHTRVDGIKNTLTLVKTKKGIRFGGFTSEIWNQIGGYGKCDPLDFVQMVIVLILKELIQFLEYIIIFLLKAAGVIILLFLIVLENLKKILK